MPEFKSNPEYERILKAMLGNHPIAQAGKMFGYHGYKVNNKLAVGLFDTGIIAKVGTKRAAELVGENGIQYFEPMTGRVWKDWILITSHFGHYQALFEEAIQYVLEETTS